MKSRPPSPVPPAFQRGTTVLTGLTGRGRFIEGGVQAQTGDQDNGLSQRLAAVEQVEDGVAAVAHQHQGALRQPAAQLHDHLPRPVGELFVAASALPVVAFRGRQHGEKRPGPIASRPGDLAQPHQGNPAQTAGLDQVAPAGTHRIAVDAQGFDFRTAAPFRGFVIGKRLVCRRPTDHRLDPSRGSAVPTGCVPPGGATTPPD